MQNDFKENYIRQQKQQAAERSARLAKIGMGSAATGPSAQRPAQPAQRSSQPSQRPAQPSQRPAQPAQRPAQPSQRPAQPAQRPAQTVQRPAQQAQKTAQTAQTSIQQGRTPSGAQAQARRPASPAASRPALQRTPSYVQRRSTASEEELFKKELSDNESRAMMFALTGKAEQPDDGGDVDIINMGRIYAPKRNKDEEKSRRSNIGRYIGRGFAAVGLVLAMVITFVFASVGLIAHGPSETVRDLLVLTADHSSAAKWVPYMFLSADTVHGIINKSEETVKDTVSLDDYNQSADGAADEDEWANAQDGMIFETVSGPTFKAYVLLVKDPARVFVGTSEESLSGKPSGDDIFHITEFYGAVAAINGGEFPDDGGGGTGHTPIGLTYSKGKCVYNDGHTDRTFLGITKDNKLVVNEGMTEKRADELGIRDAVSFQKGNTLIQHNGEELVFYYQDGNTGVAQRTGIGQRADGTMILVVTDGRTGSSLGATHNDMIDLMVSYGAVTAGLLDGGSSSLMYYRDYYNKYDYDISKLDEYQKMGLVNNYKAFTEPRKIPTFFIVSAE